MPSLNQQLTTLDDQHAIRLIQQLVQSDIDYPHQATDGFAEPVLTVAQQAELARTTLATIAELNPQQAGIIQTWIERPAAQRCFHWLRWFGYYAHVSGLNVIKIVNGHCLSKTNRQKIRHSIHS